MRLCPVPRCRGIDKRLNPSPLAPAGGCSPTSTRGKCSGATKASASSCRPLLLLLNLLLSLLVATNAIPTAAAASASPQNTSVQTPENHGSDVSINGNNVGRNKHRPSPLRRKRKQTGGQRQVREVDRKSSRSNHFRQHTATSKDEEQTDNEVATNYAQAQTERDGNVQVAKLHFYSQQKEPIPMHNNDNDRQYNYAKYTDGMSVIGNAILDEKHTNQEKPDKIARLQFYPNYPQSEPKLQPKPKQQSDSQVAHLTFYQLEGAKEKKEEGLLAWLAKQQVQNYQAVPITSESVSNMVVPTTVPTPTPTPRPTSSKPTSQPYLISASESLEIVSSRPSTSPTHQPSIGPRLAPPSSSVPTAAPTVPTLESWTSYYYASLSYSYEYYSYSYSYSMSMEFAAGDGAVRDGDDGTAFRTSDIDNRYGNRYGHDDMSAKRGRGDSRSYARRERRQQRQRRRRKVRNLRRTSHLNL